MRSEVIISVCKHTSQMLCFVHFYFHGLERRWFPHMFWFDAWTETAPCRFGLQHSLPRWFKCAVIPCHLSCSEKLGLICKCTQLLEAKHSWPLAVQQSWDVFSGIANSMTRQYYWDTVLKDKTNRQQTFAPFYNFVCVLVWASSIVTLCPFVVSGFIPGVDHLYLGSV